MTVIIDKKKFGVQFLEVIFPRKKIQNRSSDKTLSDDDDIDDYNEALEMSPAGIFPES